MFVFAFPITPRDQIGCLISSRVTLKNRTVCHRQKCGKVVEIAEKQPTSQGRLHAAAERRRGRMGGRHATTSDTAHRGYYTYFNFVNCRKKVEQYLKKPFYVNDMTIPEKAISPI